MNRAITPIGHRILARGSSSLLISRSSTSKTKGFDKIALSLGLQNSNLGIYDGQWIASETCNHESTFVNPSTGLTLPYAVKFASCIDVDRVIKSMDKVKKQWSEVPAPIRGELVRRIGERLRSKKKELAVLISTEMGKILTESEGEVQEAIDICDFAVGLSRQLNGSVIPSERPGHFMMERYNPLNGHVAIITAFNFPVAVYFWNAALSLVCGNTHVWKPQESVSLVAVAVTKLVAEVIEESGHPPSIASLLCGAGDVGESLTKDPRVELVSFTGSTSVGRKVSQIVAGRFGKSILELGGNNAMVVDESANLDLAIMATLFGAVGTAGQRCTSQRRLYLHSKIYDEFMARLLVAYASVKIGDALDRSILCGPVHSKAAVDLFEMTVIEAQSTEKGKVLYGGTVLHKKGFFVTPTIISLPSDSQLIKEERFVPILYVMKVRSFEEALLLNNSVTQGLSSSLFSQNLGNIFKWTGANGSDCGIVNVNIGTSGAEIGGAFGGEKETGGGRESGSDSWKQYMRRSTCTVNYSDSLPLAQGVDFGGKIGHKSE
jgi:aldehyde dehydrogenase family 7 member A1